MLIYIRFQDLTWKLSKTKLAVLFVTCQPCVHFYYFLNDLLT